MIKAVLIAAASAVLGLATLSVAQDSPDEQFLSVGDDRNWYLQRAGCTLARSENGNGGEVIRLQLAMGVQLEIVSLRPRVRNGATARIVVAVDGASEESYGIGFAWEGDGRSGYRIPISDDMLERMGAGRRLEIRAGAQRWPAIDLAGAGPAIAALRACYDAAAAAVPDESNLTNAMSEDPDNMAMDMNLANGMSEEPDMTAMDMNYVNAMDDMSSPNAM